MTYQIEYTNSAAKELQKLDRSVIRPIVTAIAGLAQDPRPHGAIKMTGADSFRIRVGQYRVVYLIDDTVITVTVIKVAHRRDVYER